MLTSCVGLVYSVGGCFAVPLLQISFDPRYFFIRFILGQGGTTYFPMTTSRKLKITWWVTIVYLALISLSVIIQTIFGRNQIYFLPAFYLTLYYLWTTKSIFREGETNTGPLTTFQQISGYLMGIHGFVLMILGIGTFFVYCFNIKLGTLNLSFLEFLAVYLGSVLLFVIGYSVMFYVRTSMKIIKQQKNVDQETIA
jgi:hypothetical protein